MKPAMDSRSGLVPHATGSDQLESESSKSNANHERTQCHSGNDSVLLRSSEAHRTRQTQSLLGKPLGHRHRAYAACCVCGRLMNRLPERSTLDLLDSSVCINLRESMPNFSSLTRMVYIQNVLAAQGAVFIGRDA